MHRQEPESSSSPRKVTATVCFYIVAALVMVIVNKAVLNKTPDLPFTFLFIQLVIAVLLLRSLALLSTSRFQHLLPIKFEVPMLDRTVTHKLLPFLSVGFLGLLFNTLCLARVDASFFQIARGLLLPCTILVSSLFYGFIPKANVLIAAFLVSCGFFVGVLPSLYGPNLAKEPLTALIYGFISCLVLSVQTVLSKAAAGKYPVLALSYWGNLTMSVLIVPLIFFNGEVGTLQRRLLSPEENWTMFIAGSTVTGIFGFLLGVANVLSIKVTSPITHMFSSAAKSVIQTLLAVLIFGDVLTKYRLGGIVLITLGTIYYTWTQSKARSPPKPPATDLEKQIEKGTEMKHAGS